MDLKEIVDIIKTHNAGEEYGVNHNCLLFNTKRQIVHSTDPAVKFMDDGTLYFEDTFPASHDSVVTAYREDKIGLTNIPHRGEVNESHRHFLTYVFSSNSAKALGLNWCLLIEYDAELFVGPVRELHNHILWTALAAIIVALVFGTAITVSIRRRLHHLGEATIAVGQGNLNQIVPLRGNDELTQLACHFNDMTTKLVNANSKLHEQAASLAYKNTLLECHITERKHAEEELRKNEILPKL